MKRGQITIFIVLGIVILTVFGLISFVSKQTSDVVLQKKVNKIYGDFLSSTGLKEYISACLDSAVGSSIEIVSLQGGKAYDYQIEGGYNTSSTDHSIPFNHEGYNYNVSYGIKAPLSSPPSYPYPGPLINDSRILSSSYVSVFALMEPDIFHVHSLTALCNWYGSNYWDIEDAKSSCETTVFTNSSVQEYLKLLIFNSVRTCVNFPQFTENTKYNISEGKVQGTLLIGNEDIFISMEYPIIISLGGKPPITNFLGFKSRPKTRLKKVHELASHLIGSFARGNKPKADANNIFFNITRDEPNDCIADDDSPVRQPCILEGMSVNRIRDYCLSNSLCDYLPDYHNYTDIINITDNRSIINGKPLMFLFAVENRAPALDYIDDFSVVSEREIDDEFFGYDPDEDNLTYSIDDANFENIGGNVFKAPAYNILVPFYDVKVTVYDNEGLYDYQEDVRITVTP